MSVEENILGEDGKYSNMGWLETSIGQYSFEFNKEFVTFYKNGWMGEKYKEIIKYEVINREKLHSDNKKGMYSYDTNYKGKETRFLVITYLDDSGDLIGANVSVYYNNNGNTIKRTAIWPNSTPTLNDNI